MSASGIASTYGLAFSISPAKPKKSKNSDEDDHYVLTLAPFTKPPKISFGTVKINTLVERNLLICNPQQFEVKLNVRSQELAIDNMELNIESMANVNFKIKWQPDKADSYKYTINFEVTNNARLKFLVHAYGVCTAPVVKKPARKPFVMLQPIKREKTTDFRENSKKPATGTGALKMPLKKENKTNITSTTKRVPLKFEATSVVDKKSKLKTPTFEMRTLPPSVPSTYVDQTFLVESIYNRPVTKATSSYDIYNISFDCSAEEKDPSTTVLPKSSTLYDIRRETCIIASPRITKEGKYLSVEAPQQDSYASNTPVRSASMANLSSSSNYSFVDSSLFVGGANNQTAYNNHFGSDDIGINSTCISGSKNKPNSLQVSSTLQKISPLIAQKSFSPEHPDESENTTPKFSDFIKPNPHKNIPSALATQLDYDKYADDLTPLRPDAVPNKNLHKTPYDLYTTCYDNNSDESFQMVNNMIREQNLLKSVLLVQRAWRMKTFRRRLRFIKFQHTQELIKATLQNEKKKVQEFEKKRIECIILVQRGFRMKRFRQHLHKLKEIEYHKKLASCVVMVQQAYRMRKFRRALEILKEQEYLRRLTVSVVMVQQAYRMRKFRRALQILKEQVYLRRLIDSVIMVQRAYRMKRFRRAVCTIKENEYLRKLNSSVLMVQRAFRMKIFRIKLVELRKERLEQIELAKQRLIAAQNNAAQIIQKQWAMYKFRCRMNVYKVAIIKIQKWVKYDMSARFLYLNERRSAIKIQRFYRNRLVMTNSAAVLIQKNWRMWREMSKYSYQMLQIIKIQRWIRSKSDRFKYIAIKRSIYGIQQASRIYLSRRNRAAIVIQRQYRMFRFRKTMNKIRSAACVIQKWHRMMKMRYEFLRKRQIICQIQALYRRIYMVRRHSAALQIQGAWRIFIAKRVVDARRKEWLATEEERMETNYLNACATRIQSWWRGYMIRKETNHILNKIRSRLSVYVQSNDTLGVRIRNSLSTLSFQNVSIPQIIIALIDLEKVTRLSPECCLLFTHEEAPETLYTFMQNCNRSVPHMDLIKFCLQIFINLAKYNETVCQVLAPPYSLAILSNLIHAYQSSNPVIFMDVCVLFILMAQAKPLAEHLLNQESFVKKLQSLYTILERRTILKQKNSSSSNPSVGNVPLNCSMVAQQTTTPTFMSIPKKGLDKSVIFTFTPEWTLSKKKFIELPDQLSALEYLLDTLGIKYEKEASCSKTPVKSKSNNLFREMSSSKSSSVLAKSNFKIGKTKIPLVKSLSVNFKSTTATPHLAEKKLKSKLEDIENFDEHVDESLSPCIGDMTVKSMASFTEEPKMNSTVVCNNVTNSFKLNKPSSTQSAKSMQNVKNSFPRKKI